MNTAWLASFVVPLALGLVWLIRLEGQLKVQDERHKALEKRFESLEVQIIARLDRIEEKIDRKADK
jgi:hypothetical protein